MSAELTVNLTLYDVIPGPLPIACLHKSELPTKGTERQETAQKGQEKRKAEPFTKRLFSTALR